MRMVIPKRGTALLAGALVLILAAGCGGKKEVPAEEESAPVTHHAGREATPLKEGEVQTAGLIYSSPVAWSAEEPESSMRLAQFRLPSGEEGIDDGEVTLFHFGAGRGGDVNSNLNRWAGQFQQDDGSSAIDRATTDNGCLQVLKASHKLGRLDHGLTGDQTGVDPEWIEQATKRFELAYCEMEPGTALFFHSNLLHRSDQNKSPNSRWSLFCCYTAEGNMPFKDHDHPGYEPLVKVPDSAIKEVGMKPISDAAHFMSMESLEEYNERLSAKGK